MQYYIRSVEDDGEGGTIAVDYSIGVWKDGEWIPGSRAYAIFELHLLGEADAYVWGSGRRCLRDPSIVSASEALDIMERSSSA